MYPKKTGTEINFDENIKPHLRPLWSRLKDMNVVIVGLIVVLFIGFATMFVTVWGLVLDATRFKAETYQTLIDKIEAQNSLLIQQQGLIMNQDTMIQGLSNRVTNLNWNISKGQ